MMKDRDREREVEEIVSVFKEKPYLREFFRELLLLPASKREAAAEACLSYLQTVESECEA